MERVQERHAGFRSLKEAVDTTTPAGRMMMQMVGAFAEFERAMLKERTKAGLDAARKEGRIRRPPGNGVAATPADLDRVFYRTLGSIAPQAPGFQAASFRSKENTKMLLAKWWGVPPGPAQARRGVHGG